MPTAAFSILKGVVFNGSLTYSVFKHNNFFFIFFLISWINERKILTIILGVITILCFAGTGYFAWKNDQIETFHIVQVEKMDKYDEAAYEFTLKSNKGEISQIWIREADIDTYDNNSMFVKAINEYQEDKE